MRVRFCVCALAAVLAATPANAQPVVTTLPEAMIHAWQSDDALLAQRAMVREARAGIGVASASLRPRLSGGVAWNARTVDSRFGDGAHPTAIQNSGGTTQSPITASLTLTQTLLDWGVTRHATHAARAQALGAIANLYDTEQNTLLAVARAYLDVARDRAVESLNASNADLLRRQSQATRERQAVGALTHTDVAQAEARLAAARSGLVAAQGTARIAEAAFQRAVGRAPAARLAPALTPTISGTLDEALARARRNQPRLMAARAREIAEQSTLISNKRRLWPSLDLVGSVRWEKENAPFEEKTTASIGVQLAIPIYQGGAAWSVLRQNTAAVNRTRYQRAAAQRDLEEQVATAWLNLETARARIAAAREQVHASNLALEGVREEARLGSRTTLEELDAAQQSLDAQVALTRARRDASLAAFTLLAATGALTPHTLALPLEFSR